MFGVAKFRKSVKGPLIATGGLRAPNANSAFATTDFSNGDIRIGTQGGTPALGFQVNGTPFYVLRGGQIT